MRRLPTTHSSIDSDDVSEKRPAGDAADRTASPFWRTSSAASQRDKRPSTPPVIGATYSHADILKFDSLSLSGDSRPRTPPSTSRNKSTPPPKTGTVTPTPPRRFHSSTDDDWAHEQDVPDREDPLAYDDDEDEFGLPSIASMRRKGKRIQDKKGKDPGGGQPGYRNGAGPNGALSAWALDNGDVAEERVIPSYPSAKKTEGKMLRPQYKDILRDPANSLHLISHPSAPVNATAKALEAHSARITRINKFKKILQASSINLPELRDSAWSGLPSEVRAMSWQLLLGYLPTSSERRVTTLERKRKEYLDGVQQSFARANTTSERTGSSGRGRGLDEAIWHQIEIDVPRTNPHLELYSYDATQRSLERILYVWAIRHPASGYVQGINDLVTPFWQVFLGQYITDPDVESGMDPGQLPKPVLDAVEADSFWCLTKLLEGIQDNYIHAQPGILRQVSALRDLTARIDGALAKHMENEGIEFIQFSFRWMNCLLMREVSVKNTIRMWDTYLVSYTTKRPVSKQTLTPSQAEDQGFSFFHLYVCAAFLVKWSSQLQRMDFQEIMMFLQSLPTKEWTEKDVELLLSEAFIWKSLFAGSQAHVIKQAGSGFMNL
ncbi:GTPase-activating protein [Recurvomyces mirabilis]|nr:GTPase-activating protein [Recurvomyces mirabilis]